MSKPKAPDFFELLEQHVDILCRQATQLRQLFAEFDHLEKRQGEIKELEHKADKVARKVFERLAATFVTPLDKEDISKLVEGLDDVADAMDAAAIRVVLFRLPSATPAMAEMCGCLVDACGHLKDAVSRIRKVSKHQAALTQAIGGIHAAETRGDALFHGELGRLFGDPDLDSLSLLKQKEVLEHLEGALDAAEDAANVLDSITLKYA